MTCLCSSNGVFHCLVDADHSDTATVYGQYPKTGYDAKNFSRNLRLEALTVTWQVWERTARIDEMNYVHRCMKSAGTAQQEEGIVSNDGVGRFGKNHNAGDGVSVESGDLKGSQAHFCGASIHNIITQSVEVYRKALTLPGENPETCRSRIALQGGFLKMRIRVI